MNNFWQRAITGTIFVVVLVGAIVLGGIYLRITFGLIVLLGLYEFFKLFAANSPSKPSVIVGTTIGFIVYVLSVLTYYFQEPYVNILIGVMILSLICVSIIELFRQKTNPFENVGLILTGTLYISLPFVLLLQLTERYGQGWSYSNYPWLVLSIFILIWCNDTFAYLTGKLIGKHKLFERISPKKTWEGFIGGVVFAVIAGIILAFFLEESYTKYITYALAAGVIGTLGDLVQSMLKRSVHVKDSGTILPGHGGILDRFDAVLFATPVIFILERFIFVEPFIPGP